jgi:hypothetical protein
MDHTLRRIDLLSVARRPVKWVERLGGDRPFALRICNGEASDAGEDLHEIVATVPSSILRRPLGSAERIDARRTPTHSTYRTSRTQDERAVVGRNWRTP